MIGDSGYGQGQILMNPLQLASIYSAFVNNGSIYRPHLVEQGEQMWIQRVFSDKTVKIIKRRFNQCQLQMKRKQDNAIYRDNVILDRKTRNSRNKQAK